MKGKNKINHFKLVRYLNDFRNKDKTTNELLTDLNIDYLDLLTYARLDPMIQNKFYIYFNNNLGLYSTMLCHSKQEAIDYLYKQ